MGSAGKHRPKTPLRTVLIAAGAAVAVLAAGIWGIASAVTGGPDGARAAAGPVTTLAPEPPDPRASGAPDRASRDRKRTKTPEPSKSSKPSKPSNGSAGNELERRVVDSGSCEASYYWQGQMTASGERFDPSELTAAHKTLAMGTRVKVTNANNGKSVTVRINDRGPFVSGRCLDLSKAAMVKVGGTGSGVIPVRYQVLAEA